MNIASVDTRLAARNILIRMYTSETMVRRCFLVRGYLTLGKSTNCYEECKTARFKFLGRVLLAFVSLRDVDEDTRRIGGKSSLHKTQ